MDIGAVREAFMFEAIELLPDAETLLLAWIEADDLLQL